MMPEIALSAPDLNWIGKRMRPTQFETNKNKPGIDYADPKTPASISDIKRLERRIRADAKKHPIDLLYNPETKQWDIPAPEATDDSNPVSA